MTPRTRKYFAMKWLIAHLHRTMDLAQLMAERSRPIPKYPKGIPPSPAIVGECGPELFDGKIVRSGLAPIPLPKGTEIVYTARLLDLAAEGHAEKLAELMRAQSLDFASRALIS